MLSTLNPKKSKVDNLTKCYLKFRFAEYGFCFVLVFCLFGLVVVCLGVGLFVFPWMFYTPRQQWQQGKLVLKVFTLLF